MKLIYTFLFLCTIVFASCTQEQCPSISKTLHVSIPTNMKLLNLDIVGEKIFGLAHNDSVNMLEYIEFSISNEQVSLKNIILPFTKGKYDWSTLCPTQISALNDSIILVILESKKMYMLDIYQMNLEEINLPNSFTNMEYDYEFVKDQKPSFVENTMYFMYCPVIQGKEAAKKYFSNVKPIGVYDIENNLLSCASFSFPDRYLNAYYYDYFPYITSNDTSIYISFGVSDSVYILSQNGIVESYLASSDALDSFKPISHDESEDLSLLKSYLFQQPRYTEIIFDKYRNWTYRVLRFGIGKDIEWHLLIFDNEFEKLYEFEFLSNEYNQIIMPYEAGILLFRTNVQDKHVSSIDFSFMKI